MMTVPRPRYQAPGVAARVASQRPAEASPRCLDSPLPSRHPVCGPERGNLAAGPTQRKGRTQRAFPSPSGACEKGPRRKGCEPWAPGGAGGGGRAGGGRS